MNFDKSSLSQLLKLNDDEFRKVIKEIAHEAGVDNQIEISTHDISKIRALLSIASEDDINRLIKQFGGKKK